VQVYHFFVGYFIPILILLTTLYLIKIKGKAKIPDYAQLRDDNFTLIAYFRTDRPEKALDKCGYGDKKEEIIKLISEIPFGKMIKLSI